MRYRLIVWDFDGTLADTLALALATYNALAARHGFVRIEDVAAVRGLSARAFLRRHGIRLVQVPLLLKQYHAATRSQMGSVRLFEGVPDLLRSLKAAGCLLGVLSSNSAENIGACLRVNGVADLFAFVVGYPRLFGKARALRRLLRRQALAPQQVLYVGDEERDVQAARQAGVDAAAVTWGFHPTERLAQQAPTFLWSCPSDVLPALRTSDDAPAGGASDPGRSAE
jgi:phosphoglycolate phosphatase